MVHRSRIRPILVIFLTILLGWTGLASAHADCPEACCQAAPSESGCHPPAHSPDGKPDVPAKSSSCRIDHPYPQQTMIRAGLADTEPSRPVQPEAAAPPSAFGADAARFGDLSDYGQVVARAAPAPIYLQQQVFLC